MKIKHFLYASGALLMLTALAACSENEKEDVDTPAGGAGEITLVSDVIEVKIGEDNVVLLESVIADGAGAYNAYSLTPEMCEIVRGNDGRLYIQALQNGFGEIMILDADNNYKRVVLTLYTYEAITFNFDSYDFKIRIGERATTSSLEVIEGNGNYTLSCDNDRIEARIEQSGRITLTATAAIEDFVATLTVTDQAGRTGEITVTVMSTTDSFTDDEIEAIRNADPTDGYDNHWMFVDMVGFTGEQTGCTWYFLTNHTKAEGSGWTDEDIGGGMHSLKFQALFFSFWYGKHEIQYPTGTGVDEEVEGTYLTAGTGNADPLQKDGKVKILRDDEDVKIVIWYNFDAENEKIERGWIIYPKKVQVNYL